MMPNAVSPGFIAPSTSPALESLITEKHIDPVAADPGQG
jgi:hypothetical protein